MSFSLLYHTAAPRRNALSVRRLLQDASAMLLPEKTFPAVFRGEGRKEHEAPDRLSRRMSACGSAAAARAGCGGDRRRTDTRRGLGALTQRHAGRRAAFPRHAHAAYPARAGRYAACFPPASSFSRSRRSAPTERASTPRTIRSSPGARLERERLCAPSRGALFRAGERLPDGRVDGAAGRQLRYRARKETAYFSPR